MNEFYRILGATLQPLDVENLKFVLAGSFTGKFHWAFIRSLDFVADVEKWTLYHAQLCSFQISSNNE